MILSFTLESERDLEIDSDAIHAVISWEDTFRNLHLATLILAGTNLVVIDQNQTAAKRWKRAKGWDYPDMPTERDFAIEKEASNAEGR